MHTQRKPADMLTVELPYRASAGILLINRDGRVWTGRRLPKWSGDGAGFIWQMPQGGIDPGESPERAAVRELEEETGIRSVDVVGELPRWLSYDLPADLVGVALKGRYRGQRQKWFAMRFWGDDSEIDIGPRNGKKAEFDRWAWRRAAEVPELIVPFKRAVYETVLTEFSHHLRPDRLMGSGHLAETTLDHP
ncbi:MAG: RNA pyrophosphohydrolase [Hyphomicrobium sp.]